MKSILKKIVGRIFASRLKKINQLKNIEKGKTCYIFGDGVSLKWYDLKKFNNFDSISLSYLPFHKNFNDINCKYCLLIQPWFFYKFRIIPDPANQGKNLKNIFWYNKIGNYFKKNMINRYKKIIFITNLSNYFSLKKSTNNIFVLNQFEDKIFDKILKKKDLTAWKGSLYGGVLFAIYLGYKKIFLVGCDYVDEKPYIGHWYEKGKGIPFSALESNLKSFIKSVNDIVDIQIITRKYNGSNKKYTSYKNHTGHDLDYKNRDKIIDKKNLNILKNWPDPRI
jgi:hypothetical protein